MRSECVWVCCGLLVASAGCDLANGSAEVDVRMAGDGTTPGTGMDPTALAPPAVSGVPCDVATLLDRQCLSCHGAAAAGAQVPLTSRADLAAPSPSTPGKLVAEVALARIQDAARPMPPGSAPTVPASDVQALSAWIAAGMPEGTCATAPQDPGTLTCTSGTSWNLGNEGSARMHPGMACQACHQKERGPATQFAGTVYPAPHDRDDCNGQSAVTVQITDAEGKVYTLTTNAAGNFSVDPRAGFVFPYRAKLLAGGRVREMATAQMSGDCNSCHTALGSPGRILAP